MTSRSDARLCLLGPVELVVGGRAVQFGGARQRAILVYLALQRGAAVSAATLVDHVWGDDAPASVNKSLTTQLARLRKIIEPFGWTLAHTGTGYRLVLAEDAFDVAVFEDLVTAARRELDRDQPAAAARVLGRARALWRGAPLEDLLDAPFAFSAAERLLERRYTAEDLLAHALTRTGDLDELVTLMQQLVGETPFWEERWALLVRALGRAGRRRDAHDAFERARRMLAEELGVEPGEELRHAQEAVLADTDVALAGSQSGDAAIPFVGRLSESTRLEAALERCRSGALQMVVITGEPGIGKTRLAQDFANRVRQGGDESLFGGCDRTAAVPLRAVLMALEPVIDDPRLDPLGSMLDDLRYLLGHVAHATGSDEQLDERARRFTVAIGAALEALTCRGPVVLIVDDVQWADRSTLALLEHLATERSQIAALVVCTHRDTEREGESRERFFVDLGRTAPVEWMALGALQPDEIRVLADLLTDAQPDAILTDLLRDASGGNPLHVVQLARLLTASGGVLPRPLPRDLTAVLRARFESLSPEARSVLGAAAVVGNEFTVELIARVRGRDALDVAEALETAHHARLVEPTGAFDRYRFVHGLVCQMVYDDLDVSRRVRLHERAARALQRDGQELPIDAALHLGAARAVVPESEMFAPLIAGARAAAETSALDTAAYLYELANEFATVDTADAAALEIALGEVEIARGNHEPGRARLAAGESLARKLERWDLVANAILAVGRLGFSPSLADAHERADAVMAVLDHLDERDTARRVALLGWLAHLMVNADATLTERALSTAEDIARAENDPLMWRHLAYARLRQEEALAGDPVVSAVRARALFEDALAANDLLSAGMASVALRAAQLRAGDLDGPAEPDEYLALARRSGHREVETHLELLEVARLFATAPLRTAERSSMLAARSAQDRGISATMAVRMLQHFVARREFGRLAPIEPMFAAGAAASGRPGMQGLLAAFRLEAHDRDGTTALLRAFVDDDLPNLARDWAHETALALAAEAAFTIGFRDGAQAMATRLEPAAGQLVVFSSAIAVFGRVDRYLGQLAFLAGDLDRAVEHCAVARALDDVSGCRLWAGWAARDEARIRAERGGRGDPQAVARLVRHAAHAARYAGSRRLLAALRTIAER
jgi:DNA-binding SARP family transcriptional activator